MIYVDGWARSRWRYGISEAGKGEVEKRGLWKAKRKRTHEEVVGVGVRPANPEKLHQVVKLAMYVAANCNRAFLWSIQNEFELLSCALPTTGCTFDSSCRISRA